MPAAAAASGSIWKADTRRKGRCGDIYIYLFIY